MRVLVIEDDDGILAMVEDILTDEGHLVFMSKGERPIGPLVREHRPDVIILDLALPTTTGETILQALWEEEALRSTPVLLTSVWRMRTRKAYQEAQRRGQPVSFLAKPYGYYDLIDAVEQASRKMAP
ncbi:MAG: response regulator [Ardenticatenaceae bacterium]|nr:response regulator [Ardenticatenaceae bacterium]HBY93699.1 hypothetical protein [Chloroflexota bacterium]